MMARQIAAHRPLPKAYGSAERPLVAVSAKSSIHGDFPKV
jgi:hypothetical protein